jgi:hypothetical protein
MTTTRDTNRQRGQQINAGCVSALQGNCSYQIRRKTAMPEATFSFFSFIFTSYHECNPIPLLRSYKRGDRGHI